MKYVTRVINGIKWKMLGLARKIKLAMPNRYICDYTRSLLFALSINRELEKYKGIYKGKDIYIIGGGPTVKKFEPKQSSNSIYIGINRAYKDERIHFDYLFAQDQLTEGLQEFLNYRGNECKKLLAIIPYNTYPRIKEYEVDGQYERYVLASRKLRPLPYDISIEPFADLQGTVFSAIQFAIYTNPEHIFLVGFDCSAGNIYNKNTSDQYQYQLKGWKILKESLEKMGVVDKIISINPVGLKGMFQDVMTE